MKVVYPSFLDPHQRIELWFCDDPCCGGKGLHRDDGPAVTYPDGTEAWWQHGRQLTDAEVSNLQGERVAKAVKAGRSRGVEAPETAVFRQRESSRPK